MRIALQLRPFPQKLPGYLIALRPILPKDAAADLPGLDELHKPPLHCNPNIPTRPGRSVSVNDLQHCVVLTPRDSNLALQPPQGLFH